MAPSFLWSMNVHPVQDEIKKQVCSFELSKKLKEIGLPQDSLFYWLKDNDGNLSIALIGDFKTWQIHEENSLSAYTSHELGEFLKSIGFMLPARYTKEHRNEADARAQLLICFCPPDGYKSHFKTIPGDIKNPDNLKNIDNLISLFSDSCKIPSN